MRLNVENQEYGGVRVPLYVGELDFNDVLLQLINCWSDYCYKREIIVFIIGCLKNIAI